MITLKPAPLSTNHIYKSAHGRVYMTEQGKTLKESYQWQVKSQWKQKCTGNPVSVVLHIWFPDQRKRDLDNALKILLDSLSHIVYNDDTQIQHLEMYKMFSKSDPRVDVEVTELV